MESNEYSAYILGYLYANGSIYVKGGRHELTISGTNFDTLNKIKNLMEISNKIQPVGGSYRIRINDKEMVEQLIILGLKPGKNNNLTYPTFLPKDAERHFIRGYFDGKGSFMTEEGRRVIVNFSCGSEKFLEGLRDALVLYGLNRAEIHQSGKNKATNYIRYYVEDTRRLYNLMYSEASIYAGDKKAKYDKGI